MTFFDCSDRTTWPEILLLPEVAEILRIGKAGLERACYLRTCVPAPYFHRPLRWRKADVVRFIDGASTMRKVG